MLMLIRKTILKFTFESKRLILINLLYNINPLKSCQIDFCRGEVLCSFADCGEDSEKKEEKKKRKKYI